MLLLIRRQKKKKKKQRQRYHLFSFVVFASIFVSQILYLLWVERMKLRRRRMAKAATQ